MSNTTLPQPHLDPNVTSDREYLTPNDPWHNEHTSSFDGQLHMGTLDADQLSNLENESWDNIFNHWMPPSQVPS